MNKNTIKGFIGGVLVTSIVAGTGITFAATNGFTDVPTGKWYTNAIQWAKDNNVMHGTGPDTFSPDQPMTRAEFAQAMKNLNDAGFLNNPNQASSHTTTSSNSTATTPQADPTTSTATTSTKTLASPVQSTTNGVTVSINGVELQGDRTIYHLTVTNEGTVPVQFAQNISHEIVNGNQYNYNESSTDISLFDQTWTNDIEPGASQSGFLALPAIPSGSTSVKLYTEVQQNGGDYTIIDQSFNLSLK